MHKNRRVRQHVNPLRSQYVQPLEFSAEQWHTVFHDYTKPLHLDLGCGPGTLLAEWFSANKLACDEYETATNENQQLTATRGSAGLFLSELSRSRPGYNFLGIDIKDEYVQRALSRLDGQGACCVVLSPRGCVVGHSDRTGLTCA
jgi:tRNA G46 methylase TrmB